MFLELAKVEATIQDYFYELPRYGTVTTLSNYKKNGEPLYETNYVLSCCGVAALTLASLTSSNELISIDFNVSVIF